MPDLIKFTTFKRILCGILSGSAFWIGITGQTLAQPAVTDRDTATEVLTEQLRAGTTMPLVLKALNRTSTRNRPVDGAGPAKAEMQRLARDAATAHALPVDYFLRLIRQESGFNHHAVSPAGAQGVAQFMPRTAAMRGLKDPFDPAEALPKSAAFLKDLKDQFGNIGLAAAAYNAGPRRVSEWLAGKAGLPLETQGYVLAITGRTAGSWAPTGARLLTTKTHVGPVASVSKKAQAVKLKNWELDLLESLTGSTLKSVASTASDLSTTRQSKNSSLYTKTRAAEINLCPSCLIQKTY